MKALLSIAVGGPETLELRDVPDPVPKPDEVITDRFSDPTQSRILNGIVVFILLVSCVGSSGAVFL